jgi:hypothetical protein
MSITVKPEKQNADQQLINVEALLQQLCKNVRVTKEGKVEIVDPSAPIDLAGCCCLKALIESKFEVRIHPLAGPGSQLPFPGNIPIGAYGGGASAPTGAGSVLQPPVGGGKSQTGGGSDSDTFIDISDNNGKGYFVYDEQGNPINNPLFITLGHELSGHALNYARGTAARTDKTREEQAIKAENEIRKSIKDGDSPKYSERVGEGAGRVGDPRTGVTERPPDKR